MDHSSFNLKKKKEDIKKSYSCNVLVWCVGVFETDMPLSVFSASNLQNLLEIQVPAGEPDSCDEHRALAAA